MNIHRLRLWISPISAAITLALSSNTFAGSYYFPRSLISDVDKMADISVFETQQGQMPGNYHVDIYVNNKLVSSSQPVRFISSLNHSEEKKDETGLRACLSHDWYQRQGIMLTGHANIGDAHEDECPDLVALIPDAKQHFDFEKMTLNISVPQASMKTVARDDISPALWDEGINALLLNYRFNGDESRREGFRSSSQFLSFEPGINVGPWRVRDNSVYTRYTGSGSRHQWKHIKTYAERAIAPLRSRLVVGESATTGDIFDSIDFRGAQLASDDDMYPDSMKGFAPVIRGIALSHARVTIKQSGYVIYQTYVSPGPFEIRDLYSMASSGDLTVLVTEADGQIRQFSVPYSAVPVLQRPGHQRYSLTAGTFHSGGDNNNQPGFAEGTLIRGFENNITAYGGTQIATHYRALSIGAGMDMGLWGAVSADITQANSRIADGSQHQGQSLRFLYAHAFNSMGTTFQLTGYRYSTKGFYTLEESARRAMTGRDGDAPDTRAPNFKEDTRPYYDLNNSRRQRFVANISQAVGNLGSLFLTGVHQSYWNTGSASTSWQAGFNSSLWGANYSLSWGYSREPGISGSDRTVALSLSIPLDRLLSGSQGRSLYATTNYTHSSDHTSQLQESLNGTALESNNLNWSVAAGRNRSSNDRQDSGSVNLNYQGGYGNVGTGYSYSKNERQFNYGLAGSAVLHSNGLTLGQPLGETNVLVASPGAANVAVDNQTGVHTDWRGYTIVPYATVYRHNRVSLNTLTLNNHTELDSSVKDVVPTRGALVRADFNARTGFRAMVTLLHKGKPLPFGSVVTWDDNTSIVGDGGQVYLSGLAEKGQLKASWGKEDGEQCSASYELPASQFKAPIIVLTQQCR
ncbi:fimbria/pilus outer membrane usher protein [Enterobacter quasiroggenkampii]|uniref:fimbria/pilus outer membrane usher protein n=1 Tax=Enterobacter quasiroggenkampii TaxID=2497436 RepID=UPI0021D2E71E|nr:fimbria/pilus outer membrane usher protein [Enterobacter quasiroggenkampii]MCU6359048.1 fimbrial biogenesis outer membrane usher protein [Enterobacter quasiroggenkampii]